MANFKALLKFNCLTYPEEILLSLKIKINVHFKTLYYLFYKQTKKYFLVYKRTFSHWIKKIKNDYN